MKFFAVDARNVEAIFTTGAVEVGTVIYLGKAFGKSYLVLEYLEFSSENTQAELGRQLALMHRHTSVEFGWASNNFMGTTAQVNSPYKCWSEFWQKCRLASQLELAYKNGYEDSLKKEDSELLEKVPAYYSPPPALLHGDLWSGNIASVNGAQVIFAAACYYRDREVDVAMTELFDGFSEKFYRAI